ncbi:MAG TPA: polysulfide reductase [Deltaproteobacteria bacterium]|nr:polysulfide reductase [Deltaproteobacteria bacterium]
MNYLEYWMRMTRCALTGGRLYYIWLGVLGFFLAIGGFSYHHHLVAGLEVTNMSDQVSWGIGIANFVYFVGVAASAVLLVYPAYVKGNKDIKEVVILGEQLAFTAIVMCLLFISTDIGRPERLWHLIPLIGGQLNLPSSLLAWDVVVFNVYLALNLHIPGYLLYMRYKGEKPQPYFYLPLVFVSIFFAVSIHTVTAFLLSGLGTRYFWNTAIMAPRFLITAFAVGPALLTIIFEIINRQTKLHVKPSVFAYLLNIMKVTLPINLFLLGCELFKELYPNTIHALSARYLFFGLDGHNMLTKFIWTATAFNILSTIIVVVPRLRSDRRIFLGACVMTIIGIWIEKGMGLIFPGFIPTPLGEIVEYVPNMGEIFVCLGVVSLGALMFTITTKVAIAILTDELVMEKEEIYEPRYVNQDWTESKPPSSWKKWFSSSWQ